MGVNGITNTTNSADLYGAYSTASKSSAAETPKENVSGGVVYEPSAEAAESGAAGKTYKSNPELIAKLQADADARIAQFKTLIEQLITKQGKTLGQADSIWSFLASGDFTVDPEVKAQAQKDIAEDGYWGVAQTSDRILDFAKALTGGDPEKMEEMREAFKKGFTNATKTWGRELPDISQKTYSAVMEEFDKFAEEAGKADTAENSAK
ncbi:MAG: hypothetical protein ACI4D5_08795 [Kineothrix sp.]